MVLQIIHMHPIETRSNNTKMGLISKTFNKPHALCIPGAAQGHINPMLKLAKLLHHKGFHITFVHTEHTQRRLLKSKGPTASDGLPDFRFEFIPDGLPPLDPDVQQHIPSLCASTSINCLEPLCELITKLNSSEVPPVSCIISDGVMSFAVDAAERFGLPNVLFWMCSACGFLAYTQFRSLVEKGYVPLKDMNQVTDGYMETTVDWVQGLKKDFRLKDFPSFIRTTDPNDIMLNFVIQEIDAARRAKALILNTFDAFEQDAVNGLSALFSRVYTIGPLQLMMNHVWDERLNAIGSNLWKENSDCIEWLDTQGLESVVYISFGSWTVMTMQQLNEFAWGLANSKKPFLWVIRPDMVTDDPPGNLTPEFLSETKDRSMLVSWCPQEQVLKHPAVGVFMTHSGWNSTIESIGAGLPMICWPFFSEQQANSTYSHDVWGTGMEIDSDVKREEVEMLVKEMMDGEKGKRMREKAKEWKSKAEEATVPGGSSYLNLDKLISEVLLS